MTWIKFYFTFNPIDNGTLCTTDRSRKHVLLCLTSYKFEQRNFTIGSNDKRRFIVVQVRVKMRLGWRMLP